MFKHTHRYTPPQPKPMVAVFTISTREDGEYTQRVEYNGAHSYSEPEPIVQGSFVRVGNTWINASDVLSIKVEYKEVGQ